MLCIGGTWRFTVIRVMVLLCLGLNLWLMNVGVRCSLMLRVLLMVLMMLMCGVGRRLNMVLRLVVVLVYLLVVLGVLVLRVMVCGLIMLSVRLRCPLNRLTDVWLEWFGIYSRIVILIEVSVSLVSMLILACVMTVLCRWK